MILVVEGVVGRLQLGSIETCLRQSYFWRPLGSQQGYLKVRGASLQCPEGQIKRGNQFHFGTSTPAASLVLEHRVVADGAQVDK